LPQCDIESAFGQRPLLCRFLGRLHHKTIRAHYDRRPRSAKARNRGQEGHIADASYGDLRSAEGPAHTLWPITSARPIASAIMLVSNTIGGDCNNALTVAMTLLLFANIASATMTQ
jgi:hypothetical protein